LCFTAPAFHVLALAHKDTKRNITTNRLVNAKHGP